MKKSLLLTTGILMFVFLGGAGCKVSLSPQSSKTSAEPIVAPSANKPTTVESNPKAVATTPPSTVAPVVPKPTPATTVDCKSDLACFSAKAKACEKAKFVHVFTSENIQTTDVPVLQFTMYYEITASANNTCQFYYRPTNMKMVASEAALEKAMKEEGKTKAELQAELAEYNKQLAASYTNAQNVRCTARTGADITALIHDYATGKVSLKDINDKISYGANISCTR